MLMLAISVFWLVLGLLLGIAIGYLGMKTKIEVHHRNEISQKESELAILKERLQGKETYILELKNQNEALEARIAEVQGELNQEQQARAAAEEKIKQIPGFENLLRQKEQRISELLDINSNLREKQSELQTRLEEEERNIEEKIEILSNAQENLLSAFKSLSADALEKNSRTFLELARVSLEKYQESARNDLYKRQQAIDQLVFPLSDSLKKVEQEIKELENARRMAYAGLSEQVKSMANTQVQLKSETARLVKALRVPSVRGRWGEVQLQRVVEMAGMVEHCDFYLQQSVKTGEGRQRPDMLVRLPGDRFVVVDAKTPLQAYLEAIEAPDEESKISKLKEHAHQVKTHINHLASKSYWEQFKPAPEFVVLFLPGESFFSAALEQEPDLIEYGSRQKVILATPTTLIALLLAVAYGWRQESLAENAERISELGRTLYNRLANLVGYFNDLRKGIERSVDAYNRAVGSLEYRILPTARKFKELGVVNGDDLPVIEPIDKIPRHLIRTVAESEQEEAVACTDD